MRKKTLAQVILLLFLVIITYLVFKNYYTKNNTSSYFTKDEKKKSKNNIEKIDKNIIKDISYTANNSKGDTYLLLADYGEIYLDKQDLMLLTKVNGRVILNDGVNITISSDFTNFNNKTFETTFINNVIVKRGLEKIVGDELYLVLEQEEKTTQNTEKKDENVIRISRNVFYERPGYNLSADIVEIDLITKNIKIYMIDKYKKVIAKSEIE